MRRVSDTRRIACPTLLPETRAASTAHPRQPNRRCDLSWRLAGLVMATVVLAVAILALPACGSGDTPTLPPGTAAGSPSKGNPDGRSLQLSKTTVKSGEIIFRTISGWNPKTDLSGVNMTLEHFQNGEWQMIYYLWLDSPHDTPVGSGVSISAVGFSGAGWASRQIRIPDVPPGRYRIRQDLSIGKKASTPITLYAKIQVIP